MLEKTMSSKKSDQTKTYSEDNRALWERPTFRRLVANYAENSGGQADDGTSSSCLVSGGGAKSCKVR
jgi:hypothetical protein